jgi:hypothetical protein
MPSVDGCFIYHPLPQGHRLCEGVEEVNIPVTTANEHMVAGSYQL